MKKTTSVLLALGLTFSLSPAAYATPDHLAARGFKKANTVPGLNLTWVSTTTSDFYKTAYIIPAANSWNNISTQVRLTKSPTATGKITVKTGRTTRVGMVGETIPYCTNLFIPASGQLCFNSTASYWSRADIISYTDQQVDFGYTQASVRSNMAHEFGHALSLLHVPTNYFQSAIMKQGKQEIQPTATDKAHLKERWGN